MGQKASGIERFLTPSLSKIEEELRSMHADLDTVKTRIGETYKMLEKLEAGHVHLTTRMDKASNGLSTEAQVLIDNISEIGNQNRDEVDVLKRVMDVVQRRLVILEAKMKELGK
ncbi:MAG: hypothetical protein KGI10_00225 [Thaumarchaeota archaeon]|nr:hypothetical protein [Nitrososphaerota archaeon]